jgi:aldose 1-epimerase
MRLTHLLPASVLPILGLSHNVGNLDPLVPITIAAEGINATFLPFGARLTSLFVDDKDGVPRDVVVGYDDPSFYVEQARTKNAYVGAIVG